MVLYLLNTLVIPIGRDVEKAVFEIEKLSIKEAREILRKHKEIKSAIGHEATARLLSILLDFPIDTNRIFAEMDKGDEAIAVQLTIRLPEGKILSEEEIGQLFNEGKIILRHLKRIE